MRFFIEARQMACEARILEESTVYTIGDVDFTGTRRCGTATTKSIQSEKMRISICEVCAQNRKKGQGQGQGQGWHGWFDDTMASDATYVHSRLFYEALLEAYKEEGLGDKASPGALYAWFQKNLALGDKEELEEELRGLKEELMGLKEMLGEGNKPEDMPFSEFLDLVKRRVTVEKRLGVLRTLTS
jgi:hypothetical protein